MALGSAVQLDQRLTLARAFQLYLLNHQGLAELFEYRCTYFHDRSPRSLKLLRQIAAINR